jgi:hypothetical protein
MPDKIRACQWGAFDVANYGDRLFPLIANEQLTARLPNLELVCHAPVGHAVLPPGAPNYSPWSRVVNRWTGIDECTSPGTSTPS